MKIKFFALMTMALVALTMTLGVGAQKKNDRPQTSPVVEPVNGPAVMKVLPDIEVTVEAFDAQGKKIPNGGYIGDNTGSKVRFTIKNKAAAETGQFTYKMVVSVNDTKTYDPPAAQLNLAANATKVFETNVSHSDKQNQMSARILADIGNLVKETNEGNNKAEIKYSAQVAH
jgi:hypothetical protein